MNMDQTRIIPPDNDDPMRTQAVPLGASTGDKTAMVGTVKALDMECIPGNRYVLSTEPSREHVLIQLRSAPHVTGQRLPLNIALVVDRSGSMEGEPLEYVKRACAHVIDLMEPTDILSIVAFNNQVDVILPARRVVNKALLKEHIARIEADGGTNIYDGIVVGCQQVASVMSESYVNRVLILTDGEPTTGIKDFASIVGQVAEQKEKRYYYNSFGFWA
jgi:Ca-activated chloride channel family protein